MTELLVVILVMLVLAAITIPPLQRARLAAAECSTVASMHAINLAQMEYSAAYPNAGYAPTLAKLGPGPGNTRCPAIGPSAEAACLIDSNLANWTKTSLRNGYEVDMTLPDNSVPATRYVLGAGPNSASTIPGRWFCSIEDSLIRERFDGNAVLDYADCLNSPVIGGARDTSAAIGKKG